MMTPQQLTAELERRRNGPHSDEHTAAAAGLAAEAIRFLNYATGPHVRDGLVYPSTVYLIAADLSSATRRMVQLFGQLDGWLVREAAAGMLGTDDGRPAADVAGAARIRLADAAACAASLADQLAKLQNGIAGLNGRGPARTRGGA